MKGDKVRELDDNELGRQSKDANEQIFRLKFQMSMGQADGLKKYRQLKKDRARMLTVLAERKRSAPASAAPARPEKGKK